MLNERAAEIYDFIKESIENGYPPTVREICSALDIRSTSTVHKYINMLVEEDLIEKVDRHNRAIKIKKADIGINVPVVGKVAAGIPITAVENITDYIRFSTGNTYSNPLFALKVQGESMINAGIYDGDMIIVEKMSYAENGDIVVALVDGEDATVKTFYKEDGYFRLQPENDSMEPIIAKNVQILGKVRALLRYF
ncbi:MAG: transcriptional repressor LexA [Clostridium sp.]|nr:transcriptional repressor LexA [Clostridium sp.]MCM1547994.1 transcriptional repressor LexA [Ruminococcus sp.]